jgi:hypothetical protein
MHAYEYMYVMPAYMHEKEDIMAHLYILCFLWRNEERKQH